MIKTFFKRFICFSLLLIMGSGCFASCGAKTPFETTAKKTPTEGSLPETPSPTPSDADTPEKNSTSASTPTPEEDPAPHEAYLRLIEDTDAFPLTFRYDGVAYKGFGGFTEEARKTEKIAGGEETTICLRHPAIGALFELTARVYPAENAYEYVVNIKNDGTENTGVFSALGFQIEYDGKNPALRGIKGDANGQYYTPYEQDLTVRSYSDRSTSGRPSHGTFPYYNLSFGRSGTFIAIGWPGRWKASFSYDKKSGKTTFSAGQVSVSTYVAPGETLRTPLMGFVSYEDLDRDAQTNAWRRYYINDVMRKIDGELPGCYEGISYGAQGKTTTQILFNARSYLARGLNPQLLWVDAGWYTGARGETVTWPNTGTHNVDTARFPDKLADVGKLTQENGMVFLLWFEVEIVRLNKSAFLKSQPDFSGEWLLPITGTNDYLVNIGDPACRAWVFGKICTVIDTAGVTGYRQDFNTDPANGWASGDKKEENRTGMTENLYVQGYLALWDAIIERYPGIYMDSCASGGGRNDLESMKRAVPLHYSDWFDDDSRRNDYEMKSKMTQALFAWLPYFKNEIYAVENNYQTRMNYAALSLLNIPNALMVDAPWELLSEAYREHARIKEYFYADYYELTEWTTNKNRWNGWEFFDPEKGEGFAVMFCHETTKDLSTTVRLKGLDADKTYRVRDEDGLIDLTATGKELTETGFVLTVPEKPYGALMTIACLNNI